MQIYPGPFQCQPNPLDERTRIDMALSEFMRYFVPIPGSFQVGTLGITCLYRAQFLSIQIIAEVSLLDEINYAVNDDVKHAGARVYFRCWYDLEPYPVSDPLARDENRRVVWGGEARCFFNPGDPFIALINGTSPGAYTGFFTRFQADQGGGQWVSARGPFLEQVGCGGITNLIQAGAVNGGPVLVPAVNGTVNGIIYRPRKVLYLPIYDGTVDPDPINPLFNGAIDRDYQEWDVLGSYWSWPWIGLQVTTPPISTSIINGEALVAACFFSDWQVRFKGSLYAGLRGNSV